MTISKISRTHKLATQHSFFMEGSNQKYSEDKLWIELRNIKNDIFKKFNNLKKYSKMPPKQKNKKIKKSYKEASNQKSSETRLQSELKNIKHDIFEKSKIKKWYYQNTKKLQIPNIPKVM